jgi:DNA-binding NarL/FixJ family response regulator
MKSIRVLIVDDNPQVRQGLTIMLNLATKNLIPDIQVIGEAKDGFDAIQLSQTLHPDAVLMDLEMPGMNGLIATQTIKAKDPSIFIIILTIHGDPHTRQIAAHSGADVFIEKSAPIQGLIQAIQSAKAVDFKETL